MTSHEYAEGMKAVAELLLSKEAFEIPSYVTGFELAITFFHRKDDFLKAAKLIGGKKSTSRIGDYYQLTKQVTPQAQIVLQVDRSQVCTLVEPAKPAVYRCEPLLTEAEEAVLGG